MNNRTIYIIAAITFIIILAFAVVMVLLIKKNSECVGNPFTYAAQTVKDKEGELINPLCSCQVGNDNFWFNNDGLYRENPLLKDIIERG